MSQKKRHRKFSPDKLPPIVGKAAGVAFIVGVLVFMLGLGLLGTELKGLYWRWNAKWTCREGQARTEKTEILMRKGSFYLDITYHLEIDGRPRRSVMRQERDDPYEATTEDAQKRQARYPVGALVPCWYSPGKPDDFHELVPGGLDEWLPIRRLWMPLLVLALGVLLCRPF